MIIKSSKHVRLSIPEPFDKALETDAKLRAAVYGTAADFEPWLADSKLFFFPDYTDHGIEHVNQVLATAAALDQFGKAITVGGRVLDRDDILMFSQPIDHIQRNVMVRGDRNVV